MFDLKIKELKSRIRTVNCYKPYDPYVVVDRLRNYGLYNIACESAGQYKTIEQRYLSHGPNAKCHVLGYNSCLKSLSHVIEKYLCMPPHSAYSRINGRSLNIKRRKHDKKFDYAVQYSRVQVSH